MPETLEIQNSIYNFFQPKPRAERYWRPDTEVKEGSRLAVNGHRDASIGYEDEMI